MLKATLLGIVLVTMSMALGAFGGNIIQDKQPVAQKVGSMKGSS